MEQPWYQVCWCLSENEGSSSNFEVPENSIKDITILQHSIHTVEFHSRTCPTFWRYLGSRGKDYEVSFVSYYLWCMGDFEELSIVLTQVEACLNNRPLVALPADDDGIKAFAPGHFLVGQPLEVLPNPFVIPFSTSTYSVAPLPSIRVTFLATMVWRVHT